MITLSYFNLHIVIYERQKKKSQFLLVKWKIIKVYIKKIKKICIYGVFFNLFNDHKKLLYLFIFL